MLLQGLPPPPKIAMARQMLTKICLTLILLSGSIAFAANELGFIKQGQSYQEVKQTLIDSGWAPVKNAKIEHASLYAQEVYAMGMPEVTDCISMEIDGCTFLYQKGKQTLEIKTITKQLRVDAFRVYKKKAR